MDFRFFDAVQEGHHSTDDVVWEFMPQSYDNIYRAPSTLYEWFVNAFVVIQRKEHGIVSKEVFKKC